MSSQEWFSNALRVSLIITGFYVASQPGYLLEYPKGWIATLFDRILGKYSKPLQKPLWGCMLCMSSLWTISLSLLFGWFSLIELPFAILTVCAINALILSVIKDVLL